MLAVPWVAASTVRVDVYERAWQDMRAAEAGLTDLAAERRADGTPRISADRPLGLAGMPIAPAGTPPCNPNLWFAIAQRPHLPIDVPLCSLGFATIAGVPGSEHLHQDAGPGRAMLENGAIVATWLADAQRFAVLEPYDAAPLPALKPAGDGTFRFATPVRADRLASLTIDDPGADGFDGRVTWLTAVPDLPEILAGVDLTRGRAVDTTHAMGPTSLATVGVKLQGVRFDLDDAPPPRTVTAAPRLPALPIPELDDRELGFDAVETALGPAPDTAPAAAFAPVGEHRLRLLILAPHTTLSVDATPGEPVSIPATTRREIASIAHAARYRRLWLAFECVPGARSAWTAFRLPAR